MARCVLHNIRLGPTTIGGLTGYGNIGTIPLSTLTSGMTAPSLLYVDAVCAGFDSSDTSQVYSTLFTMTAAILLKSGPTYSIGQVSVSHLNQGFGGQSDYHFAAPTLDIDSGNLRVRCSLYQYNLSLYALVSTVGP